MVVTATAAAMPAVAAMLVLLFLLGNIRTHLLHVQLLHLIDQILKSRLRRGARFAIQ